MYHPLERQTTPDTTRWTHPGGIPESVHRGLSLYPNKQRPTIGGAVHAGHQKTDEVIAIVIRERSRILGVAASASPPERRPQEHPVLVAEPRLPIARAADGRLVLLCMNELPCMAGSYRHR